MPDLGRDSRSRTRGMSRAVRLRHQAISEPGGLVMERKMLRGIKARAESDARQAWQIDSYAP